VNEAADRRWAERHSAIVRDVVLEYGAVATGNREFGAPLEQIPAWHEAHARVFGRQGAEAESSARELSDSALLHELVGGMQAAAAGQPEVARVLGPAVDPHPNPDIHRSPWTLANWAVNDERQWRQPEPEAER
jgi:hypothetical protein